MILRAAEVLQAYAITSNSIIISFTSLKVHPLLKYYWINGTKVLRKIK